VVTDDVGPARRVAVVTGAAQGLGKAIADRFVTDGFSVVYADLSEAGAQYAARASDPTETEVVAVELDVRQLASVQACLDSAVQRWGHVDVWVNNAARTVARPFLEIGEDEWDDVLATNLRGTYFGCRVAAAHMCERRSGTIINLTSIAGQWGRSAWGAHYAASKSGIVAVTRSAAAAFASFGVTVNAIAPAAIDGPAAAAMPPDELSAYVEQIPIGRLGDPDEVAALAVFLASSGAGFTTGATYDVNGGILMR
jgi:3-oxoacyl-[acyl-carrier protein] reductase